MYLEVIRNQVTPHCHAFAFLNCPAPTHQMDVQVDYTVGQNKSFGERSAALQRERVRVVKSDKHRDLPQPQHPKRSLHLRIYARRKESWASRVLRMRWAGLLGMMEIVSPGCTQDVKMIADDRSRKNSRVHRSVLLCAFFCEGNSVEAAEKLRKAIHDKKASICGANFLLHCDFTLEEKSLHDTCRRNSPHVRQFERALQKGREIALTPAADAQKFISAEYFDLEQPEAQFGGEQGGMRAAAGVSQGAWVPPTLQPGQFPFGAFPQPALTNQFSALNFGMAGLDPTFGGAFPDQFNATAAMGVATGMSDDSPLIVPGSVQQQQLAMQQVQATLQGGFPAEVRFPRDGGGGNSSGRL